MDLSLLFLQFLPLLVYVAVDAFFGYRAGIFAAFAAVGLMLGWDYKQTGEIDRFAAGEAALILIMGWISLKMRSERAFKFQPVVVALIFTAFLGYYQFIGKPFLVEYLPRMEKLVMAGQDLQNPEVVQFLTDLHSPKMTEVLKRFSLGLTCLFAGHALIMTYAALRLRTGAWFLWRLAIYPSALAMMIVIQLVT